MNAATQINTLSNSDFLSQLIRLQRHLRSAQECLASHGFLMACSPVDPPLPTNLPVHFVVGDFAITDLTRIERP